MSIEPKKLKAHIGKIKEYLDSNTPPNNDACDDEKLPSKCFNLLLLTELCQRGVVVPLDDALFSQEKLLENIQNAAGKAMLDESKVPKPLVAGSAVITSLVAEKLADILLSKMSRSNLPTMGFLSDEDSQSILRRCQDVSDVRFKVLLNLGRQSYVEDNCTTFTAESRIDSLQVAAILLLRIAMGNIFRAASFSNPDQPPMWKRSLDLCIKFHATILRFQSSDIDENAKNEELYRAYHISDAIFPLSNLIRIMEAKNNMKRVSELSLRLTEAYIGNADNLQSLFSEKCCAVWNEINTAFMDAYFKDAIGVDKSEKILKGRSMLKKYDYGSTESSSDALNLKILHQLLNVRIEMEHENNLIKQLSTGRFEATKNRKGLSVDNQEVDIKILIEEVRREILTGSLPEEETEKIFNEGYDGFALDKASTTLLNTVISTDPSSFGRQISNDMRDAIYGLFKMQIERLLKRAQGFSKTHFKARKMKKSQSKQSTADGAWEALESFVKPILDFYSSGHEEVNLSSKMNMFNAAAKSALVLAWMYQDKHLPTGLVESATDFLSMYERVIQNDELDRKKDEAEDARQNIVRTFIDNSEKVITDWSLWAGRCHIHLTKSCIESKETAKYCQSISLKSGEFIKLAESSPTIHAQYGLPYLMFLVCWSGFCKSSWSFCNITRAREIVHLARESLLSCQRDWGREITEMEEIMLNLGEADAECGFLSGGMTERAKKLYEQTLSSNCVIGMQDIGLLLRSHCLSGLIMIALSQSNSDSEVLVEDAKMSLGNLMLLQKKNDVPAASFHKWRNKNAFQTSLNFHLCQLRTLVAESLIRAEQVSEAEVFLEQAVTDSPLNFDAAFALGAFWLQMSFYSEKTSSSNELAKKAHIQLLKALKLNSTKADPFSLLGVWYEIHSDLKRALNCYSKSLLIDPSHPVAGRGAIRLRHKNDTLRICNEGASVSSNTNGWAWRALGDLKALSDGLDEEAVLCYQQALRSRDIESVEQHSLGIFFSVPSDQNMKNADESGQTWSALASCYRRLGKYSASLRAYESAFASGGSTTDEYFCAWAQGRSIVYRSNYYCLIYSSIKIFFHHHLKKTIVELELGLLEEATLKFEQVLKNIENKSARYSACYGLASCMLLSANQNISEGKYGAALSNIQKGIASISPFIEDHKTNFICISKLMGDLHSHGYRIPPSVFAESNQDDTKSGKCATTKIEFLEQGENIYMRLLQKIETEVNASDDDNSLLSTALNDIGINILLQARLQSELQKEGSGLGSTRIVDIPEKDEKIKSLLKKSQNFFLRAIETNQLDPMSWCGLGCALCPLDTMLSQHAFCRALQLDKNYAEAWVNLSLLYGDEDKLEASEEAIDALTQVADTPLMWIARGLLLEKRASRGAQSEETLQCASDAYRACLQTSRDPSALLGLALTCRRLGLENESNYNDYKATAEETASQESHSSLSIFLDSSGGINPVAELLHSTMQIERGGRGGEETKSEIVALVHRAIDSLGMSENKIEGGQTSGLGFKEKLCNAQQNVLKNPDDGESWLSLAKQLILAFTEIQNPSKQSREIVCDTLERAKYILKTAATQPAALYPTKNLSSSTHKVITSKSVKGATLSEAYALSSWVQDSDVRKSSLDLQRSLMLDPENCFARDMLN